MLVDLLVYVAIGKSLHGVDRRLAKDPRKLGEGAREALVTRLTNPLSYPMLRENVAVLFRPGPAAPIRKSRDAPGYRDE